MDSLRPAADHSEVLMNRARVETSLGAALILPYLVALVSMAGCASFTAAESFSQACREPA